MNFSSLNFFPSVIYVVTIIFMKYLVNIKTFIERRKLYIISFDFSETWLCYRGHIVLCEIRTSKLLLF